VDLHKKNQPQAFHHFGDDGTVGMLNEFGERLSLSQILRDQNGETQYVAVETRKTASADVKFQKRYRSDDVDEENNDSSGEKEANDNEEEDGNAEDNESEYLLYYTRHVRYRVKTFSPSL
jgi:hypothetical protein